MSGLERNRPSVLPQDLRRSRGSHPTVPRDLASTVKRKSGRLYASRRRLPMSKIARSASCVCYTHGIQVTSTPAPTSTRHQLCNDKVKTCVNCMSKRAVDDLVIPPRPLSLNANGNPASKNSPKIVHVHNRALHQEPVARLPVAMNAAVPGRDNEVVDLVSDDEASENRDFEPLSPSQFPAEPTPAGQMNDPVVRQPAPYGSQNPRAGDIAAENHGNAEGWRDFFNDGVNEFDGYNDLDIRDPELVRIMMESYNRESQNGPVLGVPYRNRLPSGHNQKNIGLEPQQESKVECVDQVVALFPGICRNHVSNLYCSVSQSSDGLIAHILDKMDKGDAYPTAKRETSLKRKREVDEDEEAARRYGAVDRIMPYHLGKSIIRTLLSFEFPETPMVFIDACLAQSGNRLFSAYRVLEEAQRTFDPKQPAYNKVKTARKIQTTYREENLSALLKIYAGKADETEVLEELQAARRIRRKADAKRQAEHQLELDEKENVRRAELEGTMQECGCCFGDYPLNRMIHCNSDQVLHWFCRGCARRSAETEIGNSKYSLRCMSMDGCEAGFSIEQRSIFLDANTIIALERNEQEAVLRMAGIENLASCPFCPYAAEYPPVCVDREFRCQAPECEKISCRLCKLESHIPNSCEEHAKENGLSIRRQIEEAMSAAIIRKCNKCGTPFVKEEGCNKMTCTRNGCNNVQCYVCSKSCGYDHFDDTRRGGKTGNCPLFESVEQRHEDEVRKAEKKALDRVRAEHPEYSEDDLKIKVSEGVLKDEERRKAMDPAARMAAVGGAVDRNRIPQALVMPPGIRILPQHDPILRERLPSPHPDLAGPRGIRFGQGINDGINIVNAIWDDIPQPPMPLFQDNVIFPPHIEFGLLPPRGDIRPPFIQARMPQPPDFDPDNMQWFGGRDPPQPREFAAALLAPAPAQNNLRLTFRRLHEQLPNEHAANAADQVPPLAGNQAPNSARHPQHHILRAPGERAQVAEDVGELTQAEQRAREMHRQMVLQEDARLQELPERIRRRHGGAKLKKK